MKIKIKNKLEGNFLFFFTGELNLKGKNINKITREKSNE
jgi:hypothetical protein